MKAYQKLLLENKAWASEKVEADPEYFKRLSALQTPEFLWIGCSDSRVPANEITGTDPGEIFVQRNIANMVVHTDLNLLSVLDYALNHLHVKNIIVCGHYGCGGIKAAMSHGDFGHIINKWLWGIKDVYRLHADELNAIKDETQKVNRLVELNVLEQVMNLQRTSLIQTAWKHHQRPTLHGWVYGLDNGIIKTICTVEANTPIDPIYAIDVE
jgi:carbonic anhydrase